MTGLDLSQLVTAEMKHSAAREAHGRSARHECRRRILSIADEVTQMNLANALLVRHAAALQGDPETACAETSGLSEEDVRTILAMRRWIADMQTTCAAIAADPGLAPRDDGNWPAPPAGLTELCRRF